MLLTLSFFIVSFYVFYDNQHVVYQPTNGGHHSTKREDIKINPNQFHTNHRNKKGHRNNNQCRQREFEFSKKQKDNKYRNKRA